MNIKRFHLVLIACFSMLSVSSVQAADYKIGFVEVVKLLNQSPQMQAIMDKLKKEFSRRDKELVAQNKQIKKLTQKLAKEKPVMSDSEVGRLERDIRTRARKLKNDQSEFQEDLTLRKQEELQKIRRQIREIIQSVAKKNKFDIVLESGVVYASKRSNITDIVLKKLKENFKDSK